MPAFCVTFSQPLQHQKYWICNVERRKSYILDAMMRAEKREANDDSKDDEFYL